MVLRHFAATALAVLVLPAIATAQQECGAALPGIDWGFSYFECDHCLRSEIRSDGTGPLTFLQQPTIRNVHENGAAAGKLMDGDKLVEVEREPVTTSRAAFRLANSDRAIELTVLRNGEIRRVTVTPARSCMYIAERTGIRTSTEAPTGVLGFRTRWWLGMTGLGVVDSIAPGSIAEKARLQVGDQIESVMVSGSRTEQFTTALPGPTDRPRALARISRPDEVDIVYQRNGERRTARTWWTETESGSSTDPVGGANSRTVMDKIFTVLPTATNAVFTQGDSGSRKIGNVTINGSARIVQDGKTGVITVTVDKTEIIIRP